MKLLLLEMRAFGPYAEPTKVNFSAMGSGLFLITGNTGSGKTMIFDAMIFVLFRVTSGSRRDASSLQNGMTFERGLVSLTFEHLGTSTGRRGNRRTRHRLRRQDHEKEPNRSALDGRGACLYRSWGGWTPG